MQLLISSIFLSLYFSPSPLHLNHLVFKSHLFEFEFIYLIPDYSEIKLDVKQQQRHTKTLCKFKAIKNRLRILNNFNPDKKRKLKWIGIKRDTREEEKNKIKEKPKDYLIWYWKKEKIETAMFCDMWNAVKNWLLYHWFYQKRLQIGIKC